MVLGKVLIDGELKVVGFSAEDFGMNSIVVVAICGRVNQLKSLPKPDSQKKVSVPEMLANP